MMLRIPREDPKGFLVMDIPTNLVLSRGLRNFQVTGNLGWPVKRGFRSQKVSSSSSSIMSTTRFRYFARVRSMDRLQHHVWPPPLSSSATIVCCKDEMHSQLHLPDHDQLTRCCCVGRHGDVSFECGMGSREKRTWWNEWVTKKEQQQQRLWRGLMAKTSMAVLDSYLLQELLSPLLHGAAGFTLLGISIGVAPEVMTLAEKVGLSFSHFTLFTKIILLRLPAYVGLALPMASLLASLLAFGRMGSDCEIIALRMGGISTLRLLRPAIFLFLAVTIFHLLLAEVITPLANKSVKEVTRIAITSIAMTHSLDRKSLKGTSAAFSQPLIYPEFGEAGLARLLYAHGFDGKSLLNVTLVEMQALDSQAAKHQKDTLSDSKAGIGVKRVVMAEVAIWDETLMMWLFTDGCEYTLGETYGLGVKDVQGDLQMGPKRTNAGHLPFLQAVRQYKIQYVPGLRRALLEIAELGFNRSFDDMTIKEVSRLQHLMHLSRNVKESRKLQVKLQQRISLPFASVIFGSVGSLLSLRLPTEHKQIGLGLTLAIVFSYYTVSVFGSLVGQLGYINPYLGAWLPNLVGAIFALIVLCTSD
ncbi:unnamed protein product [Sphagnum compactum]